MLQFRIAHPVLMLFHVEATHAHVFLLKLILASGHIKKHLCIKICTICQHFRVNLCKKIREVVTELDNILYKLSEFTAVLRICIIWYRSGSKILRLFDTDPSKKRSTTGKMFNIWLTNTVLSFPMIHNKNKFFIFHWTETHLFFKKDKNVVMLRNCRYHFWKYTGTGSHAN